MHCQQYWIVVIRHMWKWLNFVVHYKAQDTNLRFACGTKSLTMVLTRSVSDPEDECVRKLCFNSSCWRSNPFVVVTSEWSIPPKYAGTHLCDTDTANNKFTNATMQPSWFGQVAFNVFQDTSDVTWHEFLRQINDIMQLCRRSTADSAWMHMTHANVTN